VRKEGSPEWGVEESEESPHSRKGEKDGLTEGNGRGSVGVSWSRGRLYVIQPLLREREKRKCKRGGNKKTPNQTGIPSPERKGERTQWRWKRGRLTHQGGRGHGRKHKRKRGKAWQRTAKHAGHSRKRLRETKQSKKRRHQKVGKPHERGKAKRRAREAKKKSGASAD